MLFARNSDEASVLMGHMDCLIGDPVKARLGAVSSSHSPTKTLFLSRPSTPLSTAYLRIYLRICGPLIVKTWRQQKACLLCLVLLPDHCLCCATGNPSSTFSPEASRASSDGQTVRRKLALDDRQQSSAPHQPTEYLSQVSKEQPRSRPEQPRSQGTTHVEAVHVRPPILSHCQVSPPVHHH